MDKKELTIFLDSFKRGGVERVFLNLINFFLRNNIKINLILSKAEGDYLKYVPPEVNIINLNSKKVRYSLIKLLVFLIKNKPEIMLTAKDHINIIAIIAKIISGYPKRLFISTHIYLSNELKFLKNRFKAKFLLYCVKIFYKFADKIIVVSYEAAEDLIKLTKIPRHKIEIIYNPVISEEINIKAQEKVEHPWFKDENKVPIIVGVGRLVPQKDFPTLILAFSKLVEKINARLIIIGDGPEKKNLELLIKSLKLEEKVELLGDIDNPYPYIAKSSLFVLSSAWEGLPTVLIEAISLGIPVVSTNCKSGPYEILEGGKYGKLVPVGDPDALSEAIYEVIINKNNIDIKKLKEKAYDFEVEKNAKKYLKLLFS